MFAFLTSKYIAGKTYLFKGKTLRKQSLIVFLVVAVFVISLIPFETRSVCQKKSNGCIHEWLVEPKARQGGISACIARSKEDMLTQCQKWMRENEAMANRFSLRMSLREAYSIQLQWTESKILSRWE